MCFTTFLRGFLQWTNDFCKITCCINWQVLEKRISLFDYELIKENNVRSVYFGQFAGYAGMIDGLRGLGECEKPPPPDRIPTEFF